MPCHYITEWAAFDLSGITAPTGSDLADSQELYYYSDANQKILTNLCDAKIKKDSTALVR